METTKQAFCAANPNYGYGETSNSLVIDRVRDEEFPQLISSVKTNARQELENGKEAAADVVYLDHAGATLYAKSQLDAVFDMMKSNVFGNPHTQGAISQQTQEHVDNVRRAVLSFFNTSSEEYSVVFTSGATSSLKIIGEWFRWSKGSQFAYLRNCHNSVLGIREYVYWINSAIRYV